MLEAILILCNGGSEFSERWSRLLAPPRRRLSLEGADRVPGNQLGLPVVGVLPLGVAKRGAARKLLAALLHHDLADHGAAPGRHGLQGQALRGPPAAQREAGQGLARVTVPAAVQACRITLASGFPSGGRLEERWNDLSSGVAETAVAATLASGLWPAGLDVLVPASPDYDTRYIFYVNGTPAFAGQAAPGPEQLDRTALIRDILVAMDPARRSALPVKVEHSW